MQEFVKKMIIERNDLKGKIKKCEKAIETPPFGADKESLDMLSKQVTAMKDYLYWLEHRICKEGGTI